MKKFIFFVTLSLISVFALTACSPKGYGKTEEITDITQLEVMNEQISLAIEYYFDTPLSQEDTFEYQAFKSYIPSPENKEEMIYLNNIFQATLKDNPIEGQTSGYGGILSSDNTAIQGLILNVYNKKVSPKDYSLEELQEIALNFLESKQLISEKNVVQYISKNEKASSKYLTILNFDSESTRFAVGINLQFGTVTYFEQAPLDLINP